MRITRASGRPILTAPIEPAGQRVGCRPRRFLAEAREHVEIFPFDHRPVVVVAKELTSIPAERSGEPAILLERLERAEELGDIVVVEAAVAADALALQHVAPAIGEHRPADRPCLERHHRQALVIRRHDQQFRRRHRVELVGIVEESEVANARMLRHVEQ
jgi:hypothetical protein